MRARLIGLAAFFSVLALPEALLAQSLQQCVNRYMAQPAARNAGPELLERVSAICVNAAGDENRLRQERATAEIYENQIHQAEVLLWMVVFITLSGIGLAGAQLWGSYRLALRGQGTLSDGGEASFAPGKVAVRSSVVGVVILAISLGFFMVYVSQVYTIEPLDQRGDGGGAEVEAPPAGLKEIPR
jgi:hypothetical protein